MIFPTVIEEIDSRIQRPVHDLRGGLHILGVTQVVSSQAEDGNLIFLM
jgi:hypothetical protein